MTKEQFLSKHNFNEADFNNLVRFEKVRSAGKLNMFHYLNFITENNVNGGKVLAEWIQDKNNYAEFKKVLGDIDK